MKNNKVKSKRKKKAPKNNMKNEIIGISIIALSLIMGLSLYTSQGGMFGKVLREFIVGLFGMSSYTLPVLILILGIALISHKMNLVHKYQGLLLALFINILVLAHVAYYGKSLMDEFSFSIFSAEYFKEAKWYTGGYIGSILGNILLTLVGLYGSYIILIATLVIISMMLTGVSYAEIIEKILTAITDKFIGIKDRASAKIKERKREKEIKKSINKENPKEKKERTKEEPPLIEEFIEQADNITENNIPDTPVKITEFQDDYKFPDIELLNKGIAVKTTDNSRKKITDNGRKLEKTLASFGVEAKIINVYKGPTVTRYELQPKTGVKVSKIVNLADDIALNLAATGIRIEAPIPGKSAVGIEVPNTDSSIINLRDVIESNNFKNSYSNLAFALGKDIGGQDIVTDISKMPHLLIAGATGSGKSVCINTLIISILYKAHPSDVKLMMIDPKVVELNVYNGIPHLLIPVVTDPKKASSALYWAVQEMNERYKQFAENDVRDISGYNKKFKAGELEENKEKMPHIVIIIDELADLMMSSAKEVEDAICRLAQMARAAGIHLVIATQRPSVDVITGVIKANIPSRLAFAVSSGTDSRTILDMNGAEKLLGKGDMLFYPVGAPQPVRIQGAFVSDEEVKNIVNNIKSSQEVSYKEDVIEAIESQAIVRDEMEEDDELLDEAIDSILDKETASISYLQRRLRIGFNRASRLMDSIEGLGIVSEDEGSKPRRVLITREQYEGEDIS